MFWSGLTRLHRGAPPAEPRRDQPTNAWPAASFGCLRTQGQKKAPGAEAGAFQGDIHEETSRDQGELDAPILSQRTNQARRGSRKRPGPAARAATGSELLLDLDYVPPYRLLRFVTLGRQVWLFA
jgi:hypothetical protein